MNYRYRLLSSISNKRTQWTIQSKNILSQGEIMSSNYVYNQIRKSSLANIFISIVVILIVLILGFNIPFRKVFQLKYFESVSNVADAHIRGTDYAEVNIDELTYTGYDYYHRGTRFASYYYNISNNVCTFVLVKNKGEKAEPILKNHTSKARLTDNNEKTEELTALLAADLSWTSEGLKSITSTVMIDETMYHSTGYIYLAVSLVVIFVFILLYMISNLLIFSIPELHPSCRYLLKLTNGKKNIRSVCMEVNNRVILKTDTLILTKHYLIITSLFNFEIIPIGRIIWAYEHSKWHHILWHKTKLSYTLSILYGHKILIDSTKNTKEDIDTILEYFHENYENMIIGYTEKNRIRAQKKYRRMKNHHSK